MKLYEEHIESIKIIMTLTNQQLNELAQIGTKYIFERHLNCCGVVEIIKRYEKIKQENQSNGQI